MQQPDQRQLQGSAGSADQAANGHHADQRARRPRFAHDRPGAERLVPAEPALLVLFAGVVAPLALFAALAAAVVLHGTLPGDVGLQRLLTPNADVPLPARAHGYFDRSPTVGIVLLAGLCLVLAVRGRVIEALLAVVAVGGLLAVEPFLKDAFERPPPNQGGSGWSFPSGTAMVTMACACWALLVVWPQLQRLRPLAVAIAAAFVVAYGLAIVYLRWHYASDVLAGWCLAVSWVALLWLGASALASRASRRHRST